MTCTPEDVTFFVTCCSKAHMGRMLLEGTIPDVNVKDPANGNKTALQLCVESSSAASTVSWLFRQDPPADAKALTRDGQTTLHLAILNKQTQYIPSIIEILLNKGADPSIKDNRCRTVSDIARILDLEDCCTNLFKQWHERQPERQHSSSSSALYPTPPPTSATPSSSSAHAATAVSNPNPNPNTNAATVSNPTPNPNTNAATVSNNSGTPKRKASEISNNNNTLDNISINYNRETAGDRETASALCEKGSRKKSHGTLTQSQTQTPDTSTFWDLAFNNDDVIEEEEDVDKDVIIIALLLYLILQTQ